MYHAGRWNLTRNNWMDTELLDLSGFDRCPYSDSPVWCQRTDEIECCKRCSTFKEVLAKRQRNPVAYRKTPKVLT